MQSEQAAPTVAWPGEDPYFPLGQSAQPTSSELGGAADEAPNFPSGQSLQVLSAVAPTVVDHFPDAHSLHIAVSCFPPLLGSVLESDTSEYFPAGQSWHIHGDELELRLAYLPFPQGVQVLRQPEVFGVASVPAGQPWRIPCRVLGSL